MSLRTLALEDRRESTTRRIRRRLGVDVEAQLHAEAFACSGRPAGARRSVPARAVARGAARRAHAQVRLRKPAALAQGCALRPAVRSRASYLVARVKSQAGRTVLFRLDAMNTPRRP